VPTRNVILAIWSVVGLVGMSKREVPLVRIGYCVKPRELRASNHSASVRPGWAYGRRIADSSRMPPVMTAMSEVWLEELLRASSWVVRYVPSMTGNLMTCQWGLFHGKRQWLTGRLAAE